MSMPNLGVVTAKEEGLRGSTGGTAGPCQKTALSIPLNTALLSGAQESWQMKVLNCLSWSLTWGCHQSWDQM